LAPGWISSSKGTPLAAVSSITFYAALSAA
jgi:hypothetical protein